MRRMKKVFALLIALMMLAAGLAVPLLVCAWHEKRPLPRWLRLVVGL